MRKLLPFILMIVLVCACGEEDIDQHVHKVDWADRTMDQSKLAFLETHTTFVPVYSSVYSKSEEYKRSVTATVSIHNMNIADSIFVSRADYFGTGGELVRSYLKTPVYIRPMETIDIVIHEVDNTGGTGANFLIEWSKSDSLANAPLIEAVMISTDGQQGISFTTRGVILNSPQ